MPISVSDLVLPEISRYTSVATSLSMVVDVRQNSLGYPHPSFCKRGVRSIEDAAPARSLLGYASLFMILCLLSSSHHWLDLRQVSVTLGSRDVRMYPGASSEYVSVFIQSGWNAGDLLAY
jgi:hypothetical protein